MSLINKVSVDMLPVQSLDTQDKNLVGAHVLSLINTTVVLLSKALKQTAPVEPLSDHTLISCTQK